MRARKRKKNKFRTYTEIGKGGHWPLFIRYCQIWRISDIFDYVAIFEQFEVLKLSGDKWELVAAFSDFELANELAKQRTSNVRLVRASYDNGKRISEEVILSLGSPRGAA